MNKNLRLISLRLWIVSMICITPILNLSADDSPEAPASFVQVDRLPEDVAVLTERFFEIINNDEPWKLGPLMRPNLPEDQATEIYLKGNPHLADQRDAKIIQNSGEKEFEEVKRTRWVPVQFLQFGEAAWVVRYGPQGASKKSLGLSSLLWIKEKDTWKLAGFGWSIGVVKEQLKKEFAH